MDGAGHFTPEGGDYDEKRDSFMSGLGITVIRFENRDVFDNIEAVLEDIKNNFKN